MLLNYNLSSKDVNHRVMSLVFKNIIILDNSSSRNITWQEAVFLKKEDLFFPPGNLWSMPRFYSEEQELLYLTTNCIIITNNFTVQIPVDHVHFVVHHGCLSLAAHCAQLYQSLLVAHYFQLYQSLLVACQCLLAQVVLVVLYFHLYL